MHMKKKNICTAIARVVFFVALSCTAKGQSLDQVLYESSEYLRTGQPVEALDLLSEYEDTYGDEREFLNNLAIAYLGNNQPEKALSLIRELVDNDPLFSIIAHNYLELELGATGTKTDRVNPILFVQTVDSFVKGAPIPERSAETEVASKTPNEDTNKQTLLENALGSIVQSWAKAWSDKDFDRYIAHYGAEYEPRHEQSFEDWRLERETRLAKPGEIQVTITNVKIISGSRSPRIQFDQSYKSDNYSDKTRKEMSFSQDGSLWKIRSEKTIQAY